MSNRSGLCWNCARRIWGCSLFDKDALANVIGCGQYVRKGEERKNPKLIKTWMRERDKAILSYDIDAFKGFYLKWRERGFYQGKLPADDVIEVSMRKMAYHIQSTTPEQKREAEEWLKEHGSSTDL